MKINRSIVLFLLACVPIRLLLVWGSTKVPLVPLAIVLLVMSLSFLYLYFTNGRQQAPEAGGVTWWANYRLIIGLLYLAAAIYAFQGRRDLVWIPLLIDVMFGIVLFTLKHFIL